MLVCLRKIGFWLNITVQVAATGKRSSDALHLQKKNECNKVDLTMISPGGLLLVVPHLFAVPNSQFQFVGVGFPKKKKKSKLGCEKYLQQSVSHTEHHWRSSKKPRSRKVKVRGQVLG